MTFMVLPVGKWMVGSAIRIDDGEIKAI
jgi:hypothetical protein